MPSDRAALLILCSKDEAEKIRSAAKRERRTLSGYVLHAVLNRITHQEKSRTRTLPHAGISHSPVTFLQLFRQPPEPA